MVSISDIPTVQYWQNLGNMLDKAKENIHQTIERNIWMLMGVVFYKKKTIRNIYNAKYWKAYSNQYYVLENDYVKYTRIRWENSRGKQRATGCIYLEGSPFHYAEVSSQLRSCTYDAIINAALRIGGKLTNWNCIDSVHL